MIKETESTSITSPWAVVDLRAIAGNVRSLRSVTAASAMIMAVVKANAYGHGCVRVSETALASGADALGVARIQEAIRLREAGISAPVLVFGHIPNANLPDLINYDLTPTAYSLPFTRFISEVAVRLGKTVKVHVKVDTGMGRMGLQSEASAVPQTHIQRLKVLTSDILYISNLPGITLEGIYTHFATADKPGSRFAATQLEIFLDLLASIRKAGLEIPLRHVANSGALINMPESHLDMVRPGIALYGLFPSPEIDRRRIDLTPAMCLKTRVVHLKKVPANFPVSYGKTFMTKSPTVIATVPIGYADGYSRAFSNRGHMLVGGQKAPVIGRVCMDFTMLDVGHIPKTSLYDEVVVFGKQVDASLPVDELADSLDTINYEIITSVSERIPRYYMGDQSSK